MRVRFLPYFLQGELGLFFNLSLSLQLCFNFNHVVPPTVIMCNEEGEVWRPLMKKLQKGGCGEKSGRKEAQTLL